MGIRLSIALLAVALTAIGGVPSTADEPPVRSAEIRIGLPARDAGGGGVRVLPSAGSLTLELPAGALIPPDFAAASGGMITAGATEELAGGRQRVPLRIERGLLAEVRFDRGELVLRVESRAGRSSSVGLLADADEQYRLGAGDRIRITVYDHPDLSTQLTISRDGLITAPLVDEVSAAGLTPRELAARVAELLGRDFIVDPKVDVEVEEYQSQWVMVSGEVGKAGRVPLRGGTRLKEVLGEALGFSETAGEEILITRRQGDGSSEVMRVARSEFENGRANPRMHQGDIVEVVRAERCYIQGEVRNPGRVRIERGMTLMRVIAMAGGLTDWASRKNVTVMDDDQGRSRVRTFDLNKIERQKIEDPAIEGGEVIVVKKRFL